MKTLAAVAAALAALAACRDSSAPNPEAQGPGAPPYAGPSQPQRPQLSPQEIAEHITAAQLVAPPATMHAVAPGPVGATFGGGAVRYLGYEFAPEKPYPGGVMRITHYWQVLKKLPGDWTIFVHLSPPGQPGVMLNADHVALQGLYPTSEWRPGTLFRDDEFLRLPQQLPAQPLEMYVGLFQGDQRLTLDQIALGQENRLHVGQIPIGAGPSAAPLPVYKVPRAKGPITIDGKLDEPDWKRAPSTGAFVRSLDGGPTKYFTEAKLLWDDQYLYVAFKCEDEDIWTSYTKHDDPLYNQEVVEIFIDADGDGKTYNELEISPANVTFDADFKERRKDLDKAVQWESGMKTAVVVNGTLNQASDKDQSWVAEAAIPIANLDSVPHVPPHPGDRWRANLYRLDWHTNRKVNEGSAWSPLFMGDFHNLPRFGWLEFEG
ncbi:MAG TPA: carbohydrate-binding family 9-like protein [Myxococcales bacterium]|nr:carbohydrate-binding family 9-like protein [Myxococcales bacterium]